MRRRLALIAILLLVLAGLAATLWWSYRAPPGPRTTQPPRISTLAPTRVARIRVRHGSDLIMLQRDGPQAPWHLTAPVDAPVDRLHLQAVLSLLGRHARHRYAPDAIDPATTGLKNPALVVQFNRQTPIDIGGRGPSPGSRYVRTPHDLLIAALPDLSGLQWGWTHWISPALVPPHRQLKKLVLPHFTLDRDTHGDWHAQPAGQRSAAAVAATRQAWQRARALTVVPANQSRQRLARVTLVFEHSPPRHLDIIERAPNLILRDPALGVDYHLAGNRIGPLLEIRHPGL
ncbi:hypothetical protein [Salinisphaera sp. LB1]|uniref:hypothetical protein n=1 Tax=Salinisphaera sp. LB1 TaxID=2183911 RepID=UPI000D7DF888|nr:hypothetical protein [Salinisphaera sp. LB1]AWN16319.1 hypothetical protein SALB1_2121 [Salinisphaera sp. LB1]